MIAAPEIHRLTPTLAVWHTFDPSVRADLSSTAITTPTGVYFIDPIPLPRPDLHTLLEGDAARGVLVTNANHWRNSGPLAKELAIPVFAFPSAQNHQNETPSFTPLGEASKLDGAFDVIPIAGAAAGEVVFYSGADGGTMILGDALINFEPQGFSFLPPKYCSNAKEMRQSLRKLVSLEVNRILFAHGLPILSEASKRLRELLK
ncbi:MAG: hypothetical protein QOG67_2137 [Verrucomicrobiota bacterium]|jgi:hypothetical protein